MTGFAVAAGVLWAVVLFIRGRRFRETRRLSAMDGRTRDHRGGGF